jgi:NADH:ubiquinone oxidoreductase subunit K
MTQSHFLVFAGFSFSVAIIAVLRRSHLVLIVGSFNIAISNAVILLAAISANSKSETALIHAVLIVALCTIINLIFCGVVVLIFRSRSTLRLDDYRELRG